MALEAKALQAEVRPDRIDLPADLRVHDDRPAPAAPGLARPLVGGVDAELRAQARHRTCEIQVVDRRILDQRGVSPGVDPRGHRPYDLFPVADIDVVVA